MLGLCLAGGLMHALEPEQQESNGCSIVINTIVQHYRYGARYLQSNRNT
jgi:hypothetical protein